MGSIRKNQYSIFISIVTKRIKKSSRYRIFRFYEKTIAPSARRGFPRYGSELHIGIVVLAVGDGKDAIHGGAQFLCVVLVVRENAADTECLRNFSV